MTLNKIYKGEGVNERKKFFICKHCGNMIGMIKHSGVTPVCCGEAMTELVPNTVDASTENMFLLLLLKETW